MFKVFVIVFIVHFFAVQICREVQVRNGRWSRSVKSSAIYMLNVPTDLYAV